MANGDTKTNQYLDIAANGTRADLPSDTCCETRTQSLIRGVAERVMDVEDEVERLENNPDVVDIVATYADLQAYDTSGLTDKDIIRVLEDSTHDNNSTYYRWNAATNQFDFVGEISGGSSVNVVQTTGTSTTDVMSQNATGRLVFPEPSTRRRIAILEANNTNDSAIVMGYYSMANAKNNIAIGVYAMGGQSSAHTGAIALGGTDSNDGPQALAQNAIAIGGGAYADAKGVFAIGGKSNFSGGYNNSAYRLLTGLYDPQNAHDAATKGYVDGLVGNIESALNTINNGTGE